MRDKDMDVIRVTDLAEPGVAVYSQLTEAQLRADMEAGQGLFIAESPKVIRMALTNGYEPVSMLCEERHIAGDAADIIAACPAMPVYTGDRELLARITGYTLTRGVLCAMRRKPLPAVGAILDGARRVLVIDAVSDTTNIGAMFRSAAALGIDGILLTHQSCDPLNRRAVRVSMGTVLAVPWTWLDGPVQSLNDYGFKTVAMALTQDSIALDDPVLGAEQRLAIVMGTEGDGLPKSTIAAADYRVMIPMARGIDSLNVAAAAAVACWQLAR